MNMMNKLLAKVPDFFNPKPQATSPESVRLQATKAPLSGVPEQNQLRQGAQEIQASPLGMQPQELQPQGVLPNPPPLEPRQG